MRLPVLPLMNWEAPGKLFHIGALVSPSVFGKREKAELRAAKVPHHTRG